MPEPTKAADPPQDAVTLSVDLCRLEHAARNVSNGAAAPRSRSRVITAWLRISAV